MRFDSASRRAIVAAWVVQARMRGTASKLRIPHLAGKTSLREPFQRLADTGLRMNGLRSSGELHEFLIGEATEISGAERVLLVADRPDRALDRAEVTLIARYRLMFVVSCSISSTVWITLALDE